MFKNGVLLVLLFLFWGMRVRVRVCVLYKDGCLYAQTCMWAPEQLLMLAEQILLPTELFTP